MVNHIKSDKEILRKNGKSFYWAGKFLPSKYIDRAAELYSFCRYLDDIADSGNKSSLQKLKSIKIYLQENPKRLNLQTQCIDHPKYFNSSSKKSCNRFSKWFNLRSKNCFYKKKI